jgi:hypothetical protein
MKLQSVVLSLFALVPASGFRTNQRKPFGAPIGLQLYSLRDQFKAAPHSRSSPVIWHQALAAGCAPDTRK